MSIADKMGGMAKGRGGGISERMGGGMAEKPPMGQPASGGGNMSQLHDHGDGTFHTMTPDGKKTEHPHISHATAHMAAHHEPEGKHMHSHETGEGETKSAWAENGGPAAEGESQGGGYEHESGGHGMFGD